MAQPTLLDLIQAQGNQHYNYEELDPLQLDEAFRAAYGNGGGGGIEVNDAQAAEQDSHSAERTQPGGDENAERTDLQPRDSVENEGSSNVIENEDFANDRAGQPPKSRLAKAICSVVQEDNTPLSQSMEHGQPNHRPSQPTTSTNDNNISINNSTLNRPLDEDEDPYQHHHHQEHDNMMPFPDVIDYHTLEHDFLDILASTASTAAEPSRASLSTADRQLQQQLNYSQHDPSSVDDGAAVTGGKRKRGSAGTGIGKKRTHYEKVPRDDDGKRIQVRLACIPCRAGRKKCDGGEPPCNSCVLRSQHINDESVLSECIYAERKPRQKGVKRGSYKLKKVNRELEAQAAAALVDAAGFDGNSNGHGGVVGNPDVDTDGALAVFVHATQNDTDHPQQHQQHQQQEEQSQQVNLDSKAQAEGNYDHLMSGVMLQGTVGISTDSSHNQLDPSLGRVAY